MSSFTLHTDLRKCFGWDGALDGLDGDDLTWDAYGLNLFQYVVPPNGLPSIPADTWIIRHSHFGNIVARPCGV